MIKNHPYAEIPEHELPYSYSLPNECQLDKICDNCPFLTSCRWKNIGNRFYFESKEDVLKFSLYI